MNAALLLLSLLAAGSDDQFDFDTQIVPVLTKAGCNAGACHGAAAGRGGFRLSLFGSDAASDYQAIVQALEGRRVNLAKPAESLLLKKPIGYLDHGGDVALPEDSPGARLLLAWIEAGAPFGPQRRLTDFRLAPGFHFSEQLPARVQLRAIAEFDHGPAVDVTSWTLFTPIDPTAVEVNEAEAGVSAIQRRHGPQTIIARFLDRVVPLRLLAPLGSTPVDLTQDQRANFVDEEVLRTLTQLRLPVSPAADDAALLRRLRLDLTGRLPTPDEVANFVEQTSSDKRARLVDQLLASDDFANYWTLRLARQLRLHSLPNEQPAANAYAAWLRTQIASGRPFNEWSRELLTATGDSHQVGPANFPRMVTDARSQAELVGEFFLGARLGCANCHNHPLDRWTQDDYHGLAAVFSRLNRGRQVQRTARGGVTNLRTGEPAMPRLPGERDLTAGDTIDEAAAWLTSPDNGLFARATVNRLWSAMMGRGLIEPIDDLRETNPATHPELLDRLALDFVEHDHNLRHTLRLIALSNSYARSSQVLSENAADDRFYLHSLRRPLLPEVLADAIADVTGVPHRFDGQPAGIRAVVLVDPLSPAPALDILGRCSRATGCGETPVGGNLPAQLHLLNGQLINARLVDQQGRLQQLIAQGAKDEEIVREFYLRALARAPTAAEWTAWQQRLQTHDPTQRRERLEDFVWSLLNSRDFVTNH